MGAPRGTESTLLSGRGQSTLIGIVLLLGMVAIGSLGIFFVASDMLTDVEQESEHDRVEQGFIELSQQMTAVATNGDTSRSLNLDTGESGAVVMTNTGNIHIHGGEVDDNISIGAIEYEGEDGTKIAYQAGGVFRETMNQTQVKSAPPIHYEDETLSFPVVEIDDQGDLGSGDVTLTQTNTERVSSPSTIKNDVVTINVTSQYYLGWKQYFENQAGENAIGSHGEINKTHGYVEVKLGYTEIEGVFDHAVVANEDIVTKGNSDIEGSSLVADIDSINEIIEDMLDYDESKFKNIDENINNNQVSSGYYYAEDGLDTDKNDISELNLSNGNITIVIDGDMDISGPIKVVGWEGTENEVQIYTNGDLELNDGICVGECVYSPGESGNEPDQSLINSDRLQLYGKSDFEMSMKGNAHYEGIIYAPGESSINSNSGTQAIYGSVVIGVLDIRGTVDIVHDEGLSKFEPRVRSSGQLPPDITYLHVVKHDLSLEKN
ncbi:DUF7289 family protein [Natronorubrum thiooxidans]|uniref:DUF7305 domain-containing protein n=1 Tax=Natronorubrum thiooxidans TaxID=308853 RepID=A0A1N7DZE0_9EURY|nr:hypothetical protein [Natronorubrum thiooxidans]SIR81156.1 hypothetical protein SAMN05421752_10356 [Natronorubrum thiooxidans]